MGSCLRPGENFFPKAYDHVCTLDTVTGNLAVNSVFMTIRSMRGMNKFHFFSFFRNSFFIYHYCFLYHGDQRSPGGESAGGWRSTSKSTCVVPA